MIFSHTKEKAFRKLVKSDSSQQLIIYRTGCIDLELYVTWEISVSF